MNFLLQLSNRALFLLTVAFLFAGHGVNALVVPGQDLAPRSNSPLEVSFNIVRSARTGNQTISFPLNKRDASKPIPLSNEKYEYVVDVYLGTPQQKFTVQIDTGSSDLWVLKKGVSTETPVNEFDEDASSTFKNLNQEFSITYADHTGASGTFGTDDFSFTAGQPLLKDVVFAPVDQSDAGTGLIGIARDLQEADQPEYSYPNVITKLVQQGVIPKESYSIYLNSASSTTGTLILGGYDKAKIDGAFPFLPTDDSVYLSVKLDSVDFLGTKKSSGTVAVLDTGTTETIITPDLYDFIGSKLKGAEQVTIGRTNYWQAECSQLEGQQITYNFDGVSIKVDLSTLSEEQGNGQCILQLPSSGDNGQAILGDSFLRSAYVYYDLTGNQIALGQAKYTSESNIVSD